MIFKRKIYEKLLEWKNSPVHNSALLIEGARRIGKSTIVEEFAKNEFDDYLILDFRKEEDIIKQMFYNIQDLNKFFRELFLAKNHPLEVGNLIIFDEVQFCPKARECIKDFVKDGRYFFIETGSLISIKENTQDIMIPSEERRINMFPMDFEEYLLAVENNNAFHLFKEDFLSKNRINDGIHKQYLEKFREYMIIGGMPKVVSTFLETNSYQAANKEKLDIINLYNDDLRKHDNEHGTICQIIFNSIPSQLAKESNHYIIKKATSKHRFSELEKSIYDLCDFKIINAINNLTSLEEPLAFNIEYGKFKLYFCDTGLLFTMIFNFNDKQTSRVYFDFIKGKRIANMGSLFESVVVQQLALKYDSIFFHRYNLIDKETSKKKNYEIDFVYENNFKTNAIEVKSSLNYTTSSLDNLKNKYPQYKINKYVVGIKNMKKEADKITLPIYLLLFL